MKKKNGGEVDIREGYKFSIKKAGINTVTNPGIDGRLIRNFDVKAEGIISH